MEDHASRQPLFLLRVIMRHTHYVVLNSYCQDTQHVGRKASSFERAASPGHRFSHLSSSSYPRQARYWIQESPSHIVPEATL